MITYKEEKQKYYEYNSDTGYDEKDDHVHDDNKYHINNNDSKYTITTSIDGNSVM